MSVRRAVRAALLAGLPTLASCAGGPTRSRVLTLLEAVQRPFDLNDRIWLGIPAPLPAHFIVSALLAGALAWFWRPTSAVVLVGILILSKEVVDSMIIALYEPLTWAHASGSVVDVLVSVAGVGFGVWVGTRRRPRSLEPEPLLKDTNRGQ